MISLTGNNSEYLKRFAVFLTKIGISVALLLWLIGQGRLDFASLNGLTFDLKGIILFLLGAGFVFCGLLLLGYRLWLLLRFKGFSLTYSKALSITLLGSFFSVVLPGLLGGDAVKAGYLWMNVSERRGDAVTSVIIDRAIGFYSLLLLASLVLCFVWPLESIESTPSILLLAPATVILLPLGVVMIHLLHLHYPRIMVVFYSRLPDRAKNFLIFFLAYFSAPRLILIAMILSLLNHALVITSFVVASLLLKDTIPIYAHFLLNPLGMAMNAIPITPGGLGIAESAFSFLFMTLGSPNGAMIALIGRFIQYTVFTLAGVITLSVVRMRSIIFYETSTNN